MCALSLLTQALVRPMQLGGRSTRKLDAANGSTMEAALETKTTLTPKKNAIKDALLLLNQERHVRDVTI